jgi:hypothetical protein
MGEEYEQLREALIKLLCVGDSIFIIYFGTNTFIRGHISELFEDKLKIREYPVLEFPFKMVEVYSGRLYVWDSSNTKYKFRSKERIERMHEVLESIHTKYVKV